MAGDKVGGALPQQSVEAPARVALEATTRRIGGVVGDARPRHGRARGPCRMTVMALQQRWTAVDRRLEAVELRDFQDFGVPAIAEHP